MIFIETEFASYLYDFASDKYILVSITPSKLVELSPDEEKLLLSTDENTQMFIFDKEDADHITKLGSKVLINSNPIRLEWHIGSKVLFYSEGGRFFSIEIDGKNNFDITELQEDFFAMDNGGDNLFRMTLDVGNTTIEKVKIN